MRTRSRSRASLLSVAVCLLMVSVMSGQEKDKAFKEGMKARADNDWDLVARRMRDAIAERREESKEKVGKTLGFVGGDEYYPHYYLGDALYRKGDCLGAVEAWAETYRQGVLAKNNPGLASQLRARLQDCESKGVLPPGKFEAAQGQVQQLVGEAGDALAGIDRLAAANPEAWQAEAGLRDQHQRAVSGLRSARNKAGSGAKTRSQRELTEAAAEAQSVRAALASVEASLLRVVRARVAQAATEVEDAIAGAEALDRQIEGRRAELTQALTTTRQQGQQTLQAAKKQLAGPQRSARLYEEVKGLASDAQMSFRGVLSEMDLKRPGLPVKGLDEALTRATEAVRFAVGSAAALSRRATERAGGQAADVAARRETLVKRLDAVRRSFDAARMASDIAGLNNVAKGAQNIRTEFDKLLASVGPPTLNGVHEGLKDAARRFASADYAGTIAALERVPIDAPLQVHAHLFRAASKLALYQRSGEKDESLLADAKAEVERCKQLDPDLVPDARMFPRRFVAFFHGTADGRQGRPEGAQPAR